MLFEGKVMKVCIAEKPSVAREIANVLGAKNRHDGYFEGNGFQVTWTFGHLCTLKEPHDYQSNWRKWNLYTLPMIPKSFGIKLISNEGVEKQFKIIEKLVNDADMVINCGDAGQEGELIQRWVLHHAKCDKPQQRLWISSLTEEAIKEGFQKLRPSKDFNNLYAAGSARAIGDWLLGMNATRLYSLKYGDGKSVLSVGRVQTPTLALIVERQLEIENFVPVPYWELKTVYRDVAFAVKSGKFGDKDEALAKLEEIKGHSFKVIDYTTKEGKEYPPRLFDLTALQVECNRKLNLTADNTLHIIQALYEKKMTTYPRVDTTYLSSDIYPKVPEILKGLKPYAALVQPLLEKKISKSNKVFDDKKITDHHAIIPTGKFHSDLTPDEKRVFDIVTRRFISVFYPDCKVANTVVEGETNKVQFKTTGKQILEPGWRVVYQNDKPPADENLLPKFVIGEEGPHEPDLSEKQTSPPKYFTEATLLRAMETAGKKVDDDELRDLMKENGIGRPSTRANIIETLFKRNYMVRNNKRILATQTGIDLIQTIENDLLKSAELTGMWEKKMRDIEQGKYDIKSFMHEMKEMVTEVVMQVKKSERKQITIETKEQDIKPQPQLIALTCPSCKKGLLLKGNSAWGCSEYKLGCKFIIPFVFMQKKITAKQLEQIIQKGKTGRLKGFKNEQNEELEGSLVLTDTFELKLEQGNRI